MAQQGFHNPVAIFLLLGKQLLIYFAQTRGNHSSNEK